MFMCSQRRGQNGGGEYYYTVWPATENLLVPLRI
jgi:hypothetical protein